MEKYGLGVMLFYVYRLFTIQIIDGDYYLELAPYGDGNLLLPLGHKQVPFGRSNFYSTYNQLRPKKSKYFSGLRNTLRK